MAIRIRARNGNAAFERARAPIDRRFQFQMPGLSGDCSDYYFQSMQEDKNKGTFCVPT
jgi:hypothetical protein